MLSTLWFPFSSMEFCTTNYQDKGGVDVYGRDVMCRCVHDPGWWAPASSEEGHRDVLLHVFLTLLKNLLARHDLFL